MSNPNFLANAGAASPAAGNDGWLQYNQAPGVVAADGNLSWAASTQILTLTGTMSLTTLSVSGDTTVGSSLTHMNRIKMNGNSFTLNNSATQTYTMSDNVGGFLIVNDSSSGFLGVFVVQNGGPTAILSDDNGEFAISATSGKIGVFVNGATNNVLNINNQTGGAKSLRVAFIQTN